MSREVKPRQAEALQRFLDAGLSAIAAKGIDNVAVSHVTEIAKQSRPTFYAYFGDIQGLFAEIWIARGVEWLNSLGATPESDFEVAMIQLFATAHRMPELQEVVLPDIKTWTAYLDSQSELEKLKSLWSLSIKLGIAITAPIHSAALQVQMVNGVMPLIDEKFEKKIPEPYKLPKVSELNVAKDDVDSRLLQSAIEVIAASGVVATSMSRIARKSRLSTGSIYPRYANIDDLVLNSFEVAINRVLQENVSQIDTNGFSDDNFGEFIIAGLQEPRAVWRNFRIEIHIAALHNDGLKKRIRENLISTGDALVPSFARYNLSYERAQVISLFIHCVGLGFATMQNAGMKLTSLDHRMITRAFAKLLVG